MQACKSVTLTQLPAERPEDLFRVTIGLAKGRRFSALVAEKGARQLWQAQKDGQFMAAFTLQPTQQLHNFTPVEEVRWDGSAHYFCVGQILAIAKV